MSICFFSYEMLFPAQKHHEQQGTSRQRLIWGDSAQCYSGSCEFFLFCWLGGGLIEKGCGGFLFACCQRQTTPSVKSGIGNSPTEPPAVPEYYGPVSNDPRMDAMNTLTNTQAHTKKIISAIVFLYIFFIKY